jgi:hypothetical protein
MKTTMLTPTKMSTSLRLMRISLSMLMAYVNHQYRLIRPVQ